MTGESVRILVDEKVSLAGEFRQGAGGGVVVLHPHPQYGGSMHNNVVEAVLRGAASAGWSGLRFNFRGVGGSSGRHDHGEGEQDDVLAAIKWMAGRVDGPLVLAGYSFGSLVGSKAAGRAGGLAGGIWVSPPWIMGPLAPWPETAGPLLVLAGGRDEFGDMGALEGYMEAMGARGRLEAYTEADHFWWGVESALSGQTEQFLLNL